MRKFYNFSLVDEVLEPGSIKSSQTVPGQAFSFKAVLMAFANGRNIVSSRPTFYDTDIGTDFSNDAAYERLDYDLTVIDEVDRLNHEEAAIAALKRQDELKDDEKRSEKEDAPLS